MGTLHLALDRPARIAVLGSDGRAYAPDGAPMRGDDSFDRDRQAFETHYFQAGTSDVVLPAGEAVVTVWRGDGHAIARATATVAAGETRTLAIAPQPLDLPPAFAACGAATSMCT